MIALRRNFSRTILFRGLLLLMLAASVAARAQSNSPPGAILLLDNLGRVVKVPTNEVPSQLHPPANIGLKHQIPNPRNGSIMSGEVQQRLQEGAAGFQFFPAVPPRLMPYLASQDDFGNTAIRPGALIPFVAF